MLIFNLESQLEIHEVLLETLNDENQLSASCSLVELTEVHTNRDFATERIRELENERLAIIDYYIRETGAEAGTTLKSIIENCSGEQRERLLTLRKALIEILLQIKPVGKQNAEKAVARISCFDEIQGAIHKSFKRSTTYSGAGVISKPTGACIVKRSI